MRILAEFIELQSVLLADQNRFGDTQMVAQTAARIANRLRHGGGVHALAPSLAAAEASLRARLNIDTAEQEQAVASYFRELERHTRRSLRIPSAMGGESSRAA